MKNTIVSHSLVTLATALLLGTTARAEQFTLLTYEAPADFAARTDPAKAAGYWGGFGLVAKEMTEAGILRGGSALHADEKAKIVRLKAGAAEPVNGPAARAETGQLSGYFIIEVADLATALKWAAKIPAAITGVVEVRPHFPNPQMPAGK